MSAGFDIACPDLVALAQRMAGVDPYDIYMAAAGSVADDLEQKMRAAADMAEAPSHVVTGISNYVHPETGELMVGPDKESAEDALKHEVGDQFNKPGGWFRQTLAEHGRDTRKAFGASLNAHLDRRIGAP